MKNDNRKQQIPLLTISIVQKLKSSRGLSYIRKLSNLVEKISVEAGEIIYNENHEAYLILLYEGRISVGINVKGKKQIYFQEIKKHGYCLVDKNTIKLTFEQNSAFYKLKQKYILQIFEGIISLPFLTARLHELRNIELFANMERRNLVKIAFDLQEITLFIGNKVQIQIQIQNEMQKFCYYIISGQIKILYKGKPLCILGANEMFGLLQNSFENGQEGGDKIKESVGYVITERAYLYRIPANLIISNSHSINISNNTIITNSMNFAYNSANKPVNEYISKRLKWRQNRLSKIDLVHELQREKNKNYNKSKSSFVDKDMTISSIRSNNIDYLKRIKECYNEQYMKCENWEEFYGKKLDKIQELQRKRYGVQKQMVVLFPIPMSQTLRRFTKTFAGKELQVFSTPQSPRKKIIRSQTQQSRPFSKNKTRKTNSFNTTLF